MSHKITIVPQFLTAPVLVIMGERSELLSLSIQDYIPLPPLEWKAILQRAHGGDKGNVQSTYVESTRVFIVTLPQHASRHNSPSRAWAIPSLLRSIGGDTISLVSLAQSKHISATAYSISRAFPLYSSKTRNHSAQNLYLYFTEAHQPKPLEIGIQAIRKAAQFTEMPANLFGVSSFISEATAIANNTGAELLLIQGEELTSQGLNGIWSVGKAAEEPPALIVLKWKPQGATRSTAWVGKGIIYDTGGLSIKSKTGMPGMKRDMGGAAVVLAAFEAAVKLGYKEELYALLAVAENAIGPKALRPDDVITMHSGKSVEINNTDAEGRLVLADGVSFAASILRAEKIVDVATLTGASAVAIGKQIGAMCSNSEQLEQEFITLSRAIGEPLFPIPYAPELFKEEFRSRIADMKNSVKDRANAQASCAAQFIANHLPVKQPLWLHIDMSGPTKVGGQATGFGVGILIHSLNGSKVNE